FRQGGERNALGRLKNQINNDWVALTVFEYQSSPTSTDIAPNTTGINPVTGSGWSTSSTEDDIREGVRQARSANMKILLKPQLDLYTGEWRASIRPDEEGNWFASYTAMMLKYARLCNELHVEMLSIGTEYIVATQSKYTFRWRRVIDEVRRSYAGQLTYASNWSGDFAHGITQPEFSQIGFWSDLDYVGVDTYFPLTDAQSDTLPAYDVALNRAISASSQIGFVSYRYSKPVIITEIGIQSVRGALASPWDFSIGNSAGAIPDSAVQQFYYRVMIDAIGKQPWCSGMFWWHWESVTSSNAVTNYTPEDKPAAVVLRQWYSGIGI
ncbi:MAG TPA: glycoside hydrolase TIM-barrel-like domain-containing protein, partial [Bacteroidota bacterium]|nr:glycoside hydrolase TIM-barrel-like domain-containing protein [Bacteroidota bacterium]